MLRAGAAGVDPWRYSARPEWVGRRLPHLLLFAALDTGITTMVVREYLELRRDQETGCHGHAVWKGPESYGVSEEVAPQLVGRCQVAANCRPDEAPRGDR